MNELIDLQPDINVAETEYLRLLGYPSNYKPEGKSLELINLTRQWYSENSKAWVYALYVDELKLTDKNITICDIELSSTKLRNQFADAKTQSAMIVVVSAGKECEQKAHQLWSEGKPDEYFFLEVYGSAVVEHLITATGFRLCEWADKNNMAVLSHYSPGYPGWKIEDQKKIWRLVVQNKNQDLPGEIHLLESGMLNPKKSMMALFGITKDLNRVKNLQELIPCETCSLHRCQYRRVPYKNPRTQVEDVSNLQSNRNESSSEKTTDETVLIQNAKYSVSQKTLQKWSDERLQLNILDDSSVETTFCYEGTTCSNMGRKIKFDYNIRLSLKSDGYKIIDIDCTPAKNDDGYKFMCEYIKNENSLMKNIKSEKPLLNHPINDVIKWERKFSPEGCYCNEESRKHKWGLAFEVLHYSLIQQENKKSLKKAV